jgi:hypothetical protein
MHLKARGSAIFITPVNLDDVQKKSTTSMGIEHRKKANTILWKIVSVGDGVDVPTAGGVVRVYGSSNGLSKKGRISPFESRPQPAI